MIYRREIDGLRAIAVVPVILFHARLPVFSGGFVGVDIFFVISGFLITQLLLEDIETDRFSILRFYERRARRILPALLFMMLCCLPVAWAVMLPSQLHAFSESVIAVVLFCSNMLFWSQDGYFTAPAELKPLLHTWSLAVEEQFYLVFPLLLLTVRRLGRHRALLCLIALTAISFAASEWGWRHRPSANFYFAITRAWELFAGAICGFLVAGRPIRAHNQISALGLLAVLFALLMFDRDTPAPSIYLALPVIGTALVLLYADQDTIVGRALGHRLFVGIGLISYSAYLWHQPLLAFARIWTIALPEWPLRAALALLSLAIGWLSWRFVERPFRRPQSGGGPRRKIELVALGAGALFLLAVCTVTVANNRLESAWLRLHPAQAQSLRIAEAATAAAGLSHDKGECLFSASDLSPEIKRRLLACRAKYGPGIALLGDSHAMDLFGIITKQADNRSFIAGFLRPGCRPHDPAPDCLYDGFAKLVSDEPGLFRYAAFHQAGFYLMRGADGTPVSREMMADRPLKARIPDIDVDRTRADADLAYLERLQKRLPVIWFGPALEPHIPVAHFVWSGCDHPFALRPNQAAQFLRLDRTLAEMAKGRAIPYVSLVQGYALQFPRDFGNCAALYWIDGDHLSAAGETMLAGRFDLLGRARATLATN